MGAAADKYNALYKGLASPTRRHILGVLLVRQQKASPTELAQILGQEFKHICYHVRMMCDLGVVELVGEDNRKGGKIHIYSASAAGRLAAPLLAAEFREAAS